MPAVAAWDTKPFVLTNPFSGSLTFNQVGALEPGVGMFTLLGDACKWIDAVRSTTDNIPQGNGSILHHRFLTGVQMPLTIGLWENTGVAACEDVLQAMLDLLSGSLRSLLNAGDNEGRLAWEIFGGAIRMVDDVRLLVYGDYSQAKGTDPATVTATLDSQYPYAQDLVQRRQPIEDGVPVVISNTGSSEYMPVIQVNRLDGVNGGAPVPSFTITRTHGGDVVQFAFDSALPGSNPIPGGDYAEITSFANTFYLNGDSTNESPGILMLDSDYFDLPPGDSTVEIDGCDCDVLWAPAWG